VCNASSAPADSAACPQAASPLAPVQCFGYLQKKALKIAFWLAFLL